PVSDAQSARLRLKLFLQMPAADDGEPGAHAFTDQLCRGIQKHRVILHFTQPPDNPDQHFIIGHAVLPPQQPSFFDDLIKINPQRDHAELPCLPDAERLVDLAALLIADRNDPVGAEPRQYALDENKKARLERAEVAVKSVP